MNIDPAETPTMQLPTANELYYFVVRDHTRLIHALIGGQQLPSTSAVTDEEFSID